MPVDHDRIRRLPERLVGRPLWILSRVAARSSALLARGFEEYGLRGHHYRLLAALAEWGAASQADLGRDTGIDRSDVTAATVDLEARGLVERSADPEHRRRKIVTLTPAGTQMLARLEATIDQVHEAVLAPLTGAQRRELARLLSKLG
ncbi:MarR family winged helix-turn-helix transcriptional regulator [Xylanimonas sp. McL0601]|uniref:MarR family winged helix-turn-helix transcriptional regulator n=1 Tax=Xylanimonas sp. McL0601 TaxID=3414739 RepID=UPI003CF81030